MKQIAVRPLVTAQVSGNLLDLPVRHDCKHPLAVAFCKPSTVPQGRPAAAMGGKVEYAVSVAFRQAPVWATSSAASGSRCWRGTDSPRPRAPATLNTPDQIRTGTVGTPLPGVAIRIADDGEILVKGNNVFMAYRNNQAATTEALADGWFHTGDIGTLDEEGSLKITGRKKELLIRAGGKNVAPAFLEDRLRTHPLVSQCIVVGDQQPFIGALLTLDAGMLPGWARNNRLPELSLDDARTNDVIRAEPARAVEGANKAVSRPESIRKLTVPGWRLHRGERLPDAVAEAQAKLGDVGLRL